MKFFKIFFLIFLSILFLDGSKPSEAKCFLHVKDVGGKIKDLVERNLGDLEAGISDDHLHHVRKFSKQRGIPYYGITPPHQKDNLGYHISLNIKDSKDGNLIEFIKGLRNDSYSIIVSGVRVFHRYIALELDLVKGKKSNAKSLKEGQTLFRKLMTHGREVGEPHVSIVQMSDFAQCSINLLDPRGRNHGQALNCSDQIGGCLIRGATERCLTPQEKKSKKRNLSEATKECIKNIASPILQAGMDEDQTDGSIHENAEQKIREFLDKYSNHSPISQDPHPETNEGSLRSFFNKEIRNWISDFFEVPLAELILHLNAIITGLNNYIPESFTTHNNVEAFLDAIADDIQQGDAKLPPTDAGTYPPYNIYVESFACF